jgi:hypothetical protein
MTEIDRRAVIGGLALAGCAVAAGRAAAAPQALALSDLKKEADVACLYHVDFGDNKRFEQVLNNISNHYSAYGGNPFDVQLAIVAHSAGVKFFMESLDGSPWKDDAEALKHFERIENIAKNGLKVMLCNITFERLKLDREKVRKSDFIAMVPSGVATVAALQSMGFGYIKVG